MCWKSRFVLLSCGALIAHIATAVRPKVEQKVTGPVATYWMSAATTSCSGMKGGWMNVLRDTASAIPH